MSRRWSSSAATREADTRRRPRDYAPDIADLPLTGGCLCGRVRYELTEPPLHANYCHCTRCQRRSGTGASANARVAPGSVRIVAGAELERRWTPPDGSTKCFCGECGGALWARHAESGEITGVRLGTFDANPGVRPSYRQYVAYAASWEPIPDDGLPRFDEARPS